MARGWESKSVEEQIATRGETLDRSRANLTPEQIERERKRDSLILQRTRVLHDLEKAPDGRYRQTLESGLAYLNEEISKLN